MMGPPPAVAEVRRAVRRVLADIPPGELVLAACSGGPDSLALAGALAFAAPRTGHRAGGVTVDHGLQPGSAARAAEVVRVLRNLGLDPVEHIPVTVGTSGGPEAAARAARYVALDKAVERLGAAAVLLGHTRDDQAETVLLGLARGSGARSLAGMPATSGHYRRPLLGLPRATAREACAAMNLTPWHDPQNADPAYARSRVRHQALPALERALGPGVAAALARTADLLRDDADALDDLAQETTRRLTLPGGGLDAKLLAGEPRAVRTRVLHRAAILAGSPAGALAAVHVSELDALVTAWHGQRHVDLPGGVRAVRRCGTLLFEVL
ncbi:MAG: tRNA lysidine(34) synthetase TilS [Streptosporangiales bacterium]|nr:tRNA lysidine(34) synthetase TilS [Streptosporangiales bacterium]